MAAEAEAALNALKKLEANKTCVNCGNYNRFGHQNICEKVRTFVCSNCKSAHQSYSMRVKSVSMSNWIMEEVDALREAVTPWRRGSGSAAGTRKPTKDDPLDYYKQFINRVYNDKAFYDEDGFNAALSSPTAKSSSRSAPAAAPVSNLLDFDAHSPRICNILSWLRIWAEFIHELEHNILTLTRSTSENRLIRRDRKHTNGDGRTHSDRSLRRSARTSVYVS